jgi:hypothetical protein
VDYISTIVAMFQVTVRCVASEVDGILLALRSGYVVTVESKVTTGLFFQRVTICLILSPLFVGASSQCVVVPAVA